MMLVMSPAVAGVPRFSGVRAARVSRAWLVRTQAVARAFRPRVEGRQRELLRVRLALAQHVHSPKSCTTITSGQVLASVVHDATPSIKRRMGTVDTWVRCHPRPRVGRQCVSPQDRTPAAESTTVTSVVAGAPRSARRRRGRRLHVRVLDGGGRGRRPVQGAIRARDAEQHLHEPDPPAL